jgi:transposase
MLADLLLPDVVNLRFEDFAQCESQITFTMSAASNETACPTCSVRSRRVHSYYERTLADSPVAGWRVRLHLRVRRFFCDNPACARVTFSERLPLVVAPYARRTQRLALEQCQVAFEAGGEGGARLLSKLSMPASPDTLLRLIRSAPEPVVKTPRVLGVDDWAKRKGQSYGTLLVDWNSIGRLTCSDREAEMFAAWLRAHPHRNHQRPRLEYIKGATDGAPAALRGRPLASAQDLRRRRSVFQSHVVCLLLLKRGTGVGISRNTLQAAPRLPLNQPHHRA